MVVNDQDLSLHRRKESVNSITTCVLSLLQIILQIGSYSLTVTDRDTYLYDFASLDGYRAKDRIGIRLASLAFYLVIKVLGSLTRVEVVGFENFDAIGAAGKLPIISFWHDRIFLGTYVWRDRGIVVMTSKSFDGEYIARFIQRFGYGAIRGSSSRGGIKALMEMISFMRKGYSMALTVDGPRGPRHKAKPGPVYLAKKTGNPIMPFVIQPKHFWTVNSWDKMQIPMPFTSAVMIIGKPIYVDPKSSGAEFEAKLNELQTVLDDLTKRSNEWRRSSS
jgi:lysophospholipid acyltransferase (LPLAT)-like uncharacterized protein